MLLALAVTIDHVLLRLPLLLRLHLKVDSTRHYEHLYVVHFISTAPVKGKQRRATGETGS